MDEWVNLECPKCKEESEYSKSADKLVCPYCGHEFATVLSRVNGLKKEVGTNKSELYEAESDGYINPFVFISLFVLITVITIMLLIK